MSSLGQMPDNSPHRTVPAWEEYFPSFRNSGTRATVLDIFDCLNTLGIFSHVQQNVSYIHDLRPSSRWTRRTHDEVQVLLSIISTLSA